MNIGEEKKEITVVPIETPAEQPDVAPVLDPGPREPAIEPEKEPVGV